MDDAPLAIERPTQRRIPGRRPGRIGVLRQYRALIIGRGECRKVVRPQSSAKPLGRASRVHSEAWLATKMLESTTSQA